MIALPKITWPFAFSSRADVVIELNCQTLRLKAPHENYIQWTINLLDDDVDCVRFMEITEPLEIV